MSAQGDIYFHGGKHKHRTSLNFGEEERIVLVRCVALQLLECDMGCKTCGALRDDVLVNPTVLRMKV